MGVIRVDLSSLPANYDLYLYSATDSQLQGDSKNAGTLAEQIILQNARVDDYYVRVVGADSSASSTLPYTLRVEIDRTPPALTLAANPATLWPPNHKLVTIVVSQQASDDFDPNPVIKLVSITSNEPDNGLGDGDTPGDIVIQPDGTIQLRAERLGTGSGRVYTLTYSATDRAGNTTPKTVTVTVPKNKP